MRGCLLCLFRALDIRPGAFAFNNIPNLVGPSFAILNVEASGSYGTSNRLMVLSNQPLRTGWPFHTVSQGGEVNVRSVWWIHAMGGCIPHHLRSVLLARSRLLGGSNMYYYASLLKIGKENCCVRRSFRRIYPLGDCVFDHFRLVHPTCTGCGRGLRRCWRLRCRSWSSWSILNLFRNGHSLRRVPFYIEWHPLRPILFPLQKGGDSMKPCWVCGQTRQSERAKNGLSSVPRSYCDT
jgi:hypothetical protein